MQSNLFRRELASIGEKRTEHCLQGEQVSLTCCLIVFSEKGRHELAPRLIMLAALRRSAM
jgi:hypothetical protein